MRSLANSEDPDEMPHNYAKLNLFLIENVHLFPEDTVGVVK